MANKSGEVRTIIGYTVDQQSVRAAVTSAKTVEKSQETLNDAVREFGFVADEATRSQRALNASLGDLGPSANSSTAALRNLFGTARQDIKASQRAVEELDRSLDDLAAKRDFNFTEQLRRDINPQSDLPDPDFDDLPAPPTPAELRRRRGRTLAVSGRELRLLPAVRIPGTDQSTDAVGKVVEVLGKLGVSTAALFGVIGVGLPVLGLAVLAFKQYSEANNDATDGLKQLTNRAQEYYELIADGSSKQVAIAIRNAETEVEVAQLKEQALRTVVEGGYADTREAFGAFNQLVGGIVETSALVSNAFSTESDYVRIRAARLEFEASVVALEKEQGELADLNLLRNAEVIALNNAKIAAGELTAEIGTRFLDGVNKGIDALQQLNDLAIKSRLNEAEAARQSFLQLQTLQDENSAQLQERIHNLILESDANRIAIAELKASGEATEATTAAIQAYEAAILRNEAVYRVIIGLLPGVVAAETHIGRLNERINHFVGDGIRKLSDGIRTSNDLFAELRANYEKVLDTQKRLGQASIDFRDAQKKRADAEKSLAEAQANASRAIDQAQQKINDVIRDGQQERARILADADTKLSNLAYDYGIDRIDAEEDLIEALKRIRDDADLEQKNAIGARGALEFFLSKQQANKEENEEQRQARKAEQRKKRDYQRSLELLAQATSRELDIQRQRNEATLANARQALDIERQKHALEISERQKALQIAAEQYKNFLQLMQDIARSMGTRVIVPNTEFISEEEARRRLAGGAYGDSAPAPIPQDSIAGSTRSYAPRTAASAGGSGSMTIPIQINGIGLNRRQVIDAVDDQLFEYLKREGFQ